MAQFNEKRFKSLNEVLQFTREGGVVVEGKENPTDLQISQAVRKYARQFGQERKISMDDRFRLGAPHHMVASPKGTIMSKKEWMEAHGWSEEKFESFIEQKILNRR